MRGEIGILFCHFTRLFPLKNVQSFVTWIICNENFVAKKIKKLDFIANAPIEDAPSAIVSVTFKRHEKFSPKWCHA